MLRFDSKWIQHFTGKISEVVRHDDNGAGMDRGGQHMAVIRIWQGEILNQWFITCDKAIQHVSIHQLPCACQLFAFEVWPIGQYVAYPFIVNLVAPAQPNEIGHRQMH